MARPGNVIEHPVTGERITFLRTAAQSRTPRISAPLPIPVRAAAEANPARCVPWRRVVGTSHIVDMPFGTIGN
jgi:hypothetical protein